MTREDLVERGCKRNDGVYKGGRQGGGRGGGGAEMERLQWRKVVHGDWVREAVTYKGEMGKW